MPPHANAFAPIALDEIYRRKPATPSVLVADGYGIDIRVHRGQLTVADGIGATRRLRQLTRSQRTVRRLVILGDTGTVTLDAIRWCADVGITLAQLDRDGRPLLVASPQGRDDSRLRRAQALSPTNPVGLDVTRYLLSAKLAGHADVLRHLDQQVAAARMGDHLAPLAAAASLSGMVDVEAQAANLYFGAWTDVHTRWASRDTKLVPDHWRTFASRRSPLRASKSPRDAADPINALLNYAYALAEVECRNACVVLGLDPGLGIVHRDTPNRDSMALDLLEAIRPDVDRTVLDLLNTRHLRRNDFRETRTGGCQLLAPLTHQLADHMTDWARALAPHAEHVTRLLADAADGKVRVSTPLTGVNYRKAQNAVRVQRRQHRADQSTPQVNSCRDCGTVLPDSKRVLCDTCWPIQRRKLAAERAAAGRARRAELTDDGQDPAQSTAAKAARTAGRATRAEAERAWKQAQTDVVPDWVHYDAVTRPALANIPLSRMQTVTGLSVAGCSVIRSGARRPHPRHLAALVSLVETLDP